MEPPTPINLLLVEDDNVHARIIRRAFGDHTGSAVVHHVQDGHLALDYVHGRGEYADRSKYPHPDMILLDLRLPQMDGIDVLKQLKTDGSTCMIPVIVLTTSNRSSDINECYHHGANVFIVKPLDFNELRRKINDLHRFWTQTSERPVLVSD